MSAVETDMTDVIHKVFSQLGLNKDWTDLDTIDNGCKFVLDNQDLLNETLPRRVVGDLSLLASEIPAVRRRSLLCFARRLATCLNAAIIRKRKQIRIGKKTVSKYSYKLITA